MLKKIPGIELVEMPRNRMGSRCCGAGGGYKSAFNDLAVNIAAERVKEAVATGAEILVTTCPFCVVNLQAGAKQIGADHQGPGHLRATAGGHRSGGSASHPRGGQGGCQGRRQSP